MKKIINIIPLAFLLIGCASGAEQQNNYRNSTFNVTFLNWDGSLLDTSFVRYGGTAYYSGPTPTRPTKGFTSYVFSGWDKNLENVTYDFSTVAQYDEVQDESDPEYTNCYLTMQEVSGGYDIKSISTCKSKTKMVLPDYYEGRPVVSIGYGRDANSYNKLYPSTGSSISEIKFPAHVRTIGYGSFYYYEKEPSFEKLEFPEELESIGEWAFRVIDTLRSIKCNAKLKSIGDLAFFGCAKLTYLQLSRDLQSIGKNAFYAAFDDNSSISIYIPRSVSFIGEKAFYDTHYEHQGSDYKEMPAHITIYCEAESQPSGWDAKWNWYGEYQYYNQPAPAYTTHWGVAFPY